MVNVFLFCDFLLPGTKFKSGPRSKEGFVGFSNAHCEQHQQLHEESFPQSVHSWTVASYLDLRMQSNLFIRWNWIWISLLL